MKIRALGIAELKEDIWIIGSCSENGNINIYIYIVVISFCHSFSSIENIISGIYSLRRILTTVQLADIRSEMGSCGRLIIIIMKIYLERSSYDAI